MVKTVTYQPRDFIVPLYINGLEGRVLRIEGDRKRRHKEILFVYGHHSSLERWWGAMLAFRHYGNVTMPDLPGFGGMDSFYKIGKKPTIDNLADYLASFIKMQYKRKKIIIAGMSFGFVIVTRMLQRYPEMTKRVELLISIVGFAHKDDFIFSKPRYYSYLLGAHIFKYKPTATLFKYIGLNPSVLRAIYARTSNAKHKFKNAKSKDDFSYLMDIEIGLWHDNDVQTYMFTTTEFLRFDNCKKRINLPVWHVSAQADHFFDNNLIEQHMRIIFTDFYHLPTTMTTHAPSVIADEAMASPLIPPKLRQILLNL